MNKLLAVIAATVAFATPAISADLRPMPAKTAPMAAYAPAAMWSGLYVGIHGGYGWGETDYYERGVSFFFCCGAPRSTRVNHDLDGGMVGGHIGFNWQINQLVLGIEAAGTWADLKGSIVSPFFAADRFSSEIGAIGTLTPRLGIAAGNALFYVKGGLAVADVQTRASSNILCAPFCLPVGGYAEASETRVGWTIGGGLEFAMTPNWIFGVEGNYYDFGSLEVRDGVRFTGSGVLVNGLCGALCRNQYDLDVTAWSVLGRVSYKFGGAAPVMARY